MNFPAPISAPISDLAYPWCVCVGGNVLITVSKAINRFLRFLLSPLLSNSSWWEKCINFGSVAVGDGAGGKKPVNLWLLHPACQEWKKDNGRRATIPSEMLFLCQTCS